MCGSLEHRNAQHLHKNVRVNTCCPSDPLLDGLLVEREVGPATYGSWPFMQGAKLSVEGSEAEVEALLITV